PVPAARIMAGARNRPARAEKNEKKKPLPALRSRRRRETVAARRELAMRHGPRPSDTRPPSKPRRPRAAHRPERGDAARSDSGSVLYGWHTVKAALENPARRVRRLYATDDAAPRLADEGAP